MNEEQTLEKLAHGLESTSRLAQALLHEIKESEADFAAVKTELAILRDNVKSLSKIVREGNGEMSMLTKIALMDQEIRNLIRSIDGQKGIHESLSRDIISIQRSVEDINKRLSLLENETSSHKKLQMDSIQRDLDLAHQKNKSEEKLKEEKVKFWTRIIGALVIAAISALITYVLK